MIDKIYIPTVRRIDDQETYNNLPKELQKKVVFVIQDWEKDQYKYDNEYLILPPDITLGSKNALSRTRKIIYQTAKTERYAMLDDDIKFFRRNSKWWTGTGSGSSYVRGVSNMEKSSQVCSQDDVLEMFETFDSWLDDGVTFTGCTQQSIPPRNYQYVDNHSMSSCYWINGYDWADKIEEMRLDEVKVAQDVLLILGLLSRGYKNRVSNEFCFSNKSLNKSAKSVHWDQTEFDEVHENHKLIAEMYPKYFNILYDENGERVKGGFRDYGKTSVKWSQAYKDSQVNTLIFE